MLKLKLIIETCQVG